MATADKLHDLPPHLEVKPSLIPGAGMGLFTRRAIKKKKRIGRYRGVIYSSRIDAYRSTPKNHRPYFINGIQNEVIDGYSFKNHMRWANHSSTPNAYAILENDGVIFFEAARDLAAGEEIYINYGYDPTVAEESEPIQRCRRCHSARVSKDLISMSASQGSCCITCWLRPPVTII